MKRLYERILEWDWEIVLYSLTLACFFAAAWWAGDAVAGFLLP